MNIDISSFKQSFFEEAIELLDGFESHLLRIEESPDDVELLNSIFRCAHSIKGGSATFGFDELASFTHSLETLLDCVRKGQIAITKPLCTVLLESLDQMRALLNDAMGETSEAPESDALILRIDAIIHGVEVEAEPTDDLEEGWGLLQESRLFEMTLRPGVDCLREGADPLALIQELKGIADVLSITCNTFSLPPLAEMDPESGYLSWTAMLHTPASEDRLKALFEALGPSAVIEFYQPGGSDESNEFSPKPVPVQDDSLPKRSAPATGSVAKDGSTIKVSSDKLDKLINLVGELVISQSMLKSVTENFEISKMPQLLETVALMERSSRELQERVMGMRLLPIKMAFGRFPRLVHDISSCIGKKIELRLVGEDTELDKNLIEAIGDPLTHLVRNSIDHGLETPEERRAAGKLEVGLLTISAFQEGGTIVIEVADDGRGLSRDRILAKAIDQGLVTSEDSLTNEQIYDLCFQPGFSTAEKLTDLSGRGVGMDIVKQSIVSFGGAIKVSSEPGQGVSTRIRLPLTMAILEGQSMSVGGAVYIVPLTSILENIRPRQEDVHFVAQLGEVVAVRGEYLPVVRLHEVFGIEPATRDLWKGSLVLVEGDGRKVALFADELMGQGQVVIKSLESNYRKVFGIAGATILGDGRVALIIDVPGLVREMKEGVVAHYAAA